MSPPERRAGGERRLEERMATVEQQAKDNRRALQSIAPMSVHFAEINLLYKETKEGIGRIEADTKAGIGRIETSLERMQERVDRRFDHLHTRLRRAEYAVIALSVTGIGTLAGRVIPQVGAAALAPGPLGWLLLLLT